MPRSPLRHVIGRMLCALSVLLLPVAAQCQTCTNYADYPHWESGVRMPLGADCLARSGRYACVAGVVNVFESTTVALSMIDVEDHPGPSRVGYAEITFDGLLLEEATDVEIAGHYAVVLVSKLLVIFDIENPAEPAFLSSTDLDPLVGEVRSRLVVSGGRAFVCLEDIEWITVDISDPASPQWIGAFPAYGHLGDVAVAGNHALLADPVNGLVVSDVSDPASPVAAGSLALPCYRVKVDGDRAYLAAGASLAVVDLSNPASPALMGNVSLEPGFVFDLLVRGDSVCVESESRRTQVVDVSDPASPRWAGTLATGTRLFSVEDPYAYGLGWAGFSVLHVPRLESPPVVGSVAVPGIVGEIAVAGPYAFVANGRYGGGGLQVIDIADPASPVMAADLPLGGRPFSLATDGSFAYVLDADTLKVVDVRNPTSPARLAGLEIPTQGSGLRDVALSGSAAFIAAPNGLHVVDVSDPAAPTLRSSLDVSDGYDVAVAGDHAYITHVMSESPYSLVVGIADVSDPGHPLFLGDISGGFRVAVSGNHLIVTGDSLAIYDISAPAAPVRTGAVLNPAGAAGIQTCSGSFLYMTCPEGVAVVNIQDPGEPRFEGYIPMAELSVAPAGNVILVSSRISVNSSRLATVPAPCATTPVSLAGFTARALDGLVELSWSIVADDDFVGFNVYRSRPGSAFIRLNQELIPAGEPPAYRDVTVGPQLTYRYRLSAIERNGSESMLGEISVSTPGIPVPVRALGPCRPNPSGGPLTIPFVLSRGSRVALSIHDLSGRLVRRLADSEFPDGMHAVLWDGRDDRGTAVASGVYFVHLEAGNGLRSEKVVVRR